VVKVSIELEIDPDKLLKALNGNLPEDIRVIHAKNSDAEFHPTVNAISKEYHYRFTCTRQPTALQNDLIGNYAFDLDVEKMRKACQILVGEHDFANHFCQGTDVSSTVRIIFECDICHKSYKRCNKVHHEKSKKCKKAKAHPAKISRHPHC
jgi:tRNA pseudouridine38-40 synthase